MSQPTQERSLLPPAEWLQLVKHAPLVSIDLIIQDEEDRVLLGWRNNEPARETWFVPGGVIRKGESLDEAFRRVAQSELGLHIERSVARFVGAFEHFYETNFAGIDGITTHYVVLAHALRLPQLPVRPADQQHRELIRLAPAELLAHPDVHENTKAYFR